MIALQPFVSTFVSKFLRFGRVRTPERDVQAGVQTTAKPAVLPAEKADDEAAFLTSIAGLPTEERTQRIARRDWYRQLAERQGIMDAEREAERRLWK